MDIINLRDGSIACGDAEQALQKIPSNMVDMVLTSPPYDKQRKYDGYDFAFKPIAQQLARVLKPGGVIIWVVNDATLNGSESLSSFRQALYFRQKCNLRLHDTMLFCKNNPVPGDHGPRYRGSFEYMFCFSKGKPKTFNPITFKTKDKMKFVERFRLEETGRRKLPTAPEALLKEISERPHPNLFFYTVATNRHKGKKHPAVFPDALAEDQIRTWTNPGEFVLDPFLGSGTTARMATILGRRFLGIDISSDYCELAAANIKGAENFVPLLDAEETAEPKLIPFDFS